jgi:uncharacterized protein involved in exopolysaccharide biosynthesis
MILSVAAVYLTPPYYVSTARVLVERYKSPTQTFDTVPFPVEIFEAITSEMEIITSRTVAEDVVDRLRLVDRPVRDTFARRVQDRIRDVLDNLGLLVRLDRRETLIRNVQSGLDVAPAPQSLVLVISYGAESPTEAAEIARAVTESYLARHREIYSVDTVAFFEERVRESGQELAQVREQLRRETDQTRSQSLLLEVSVLEKAYSLYRDNLNKAKTEMVTDQSLINVRTIDTPVVPARPARSRMFSLFLAFVGALVLSISLSLLREYFDHTIYSERDVEGYLNLPVVGSVVFVDGGLSSPGLGAVTGRRLSSSSREPAGV